MVSGQLRPRFRWLPGGLKMKPHLCGAYKAQITWPLPTFAALPVSLPPPPPSGPSVSASLCTRLFIHWTCNVDSDACSCKSHTRHPVRRLTRFSRPRLCTPPHTPDSHSSPACRWSVLGLCPPHPDSDSERCSSRACTYLALGRAASLWGVWEQREGEAVSDSRVLSRNRLNKLSLPSKCAHGALGKCWMWSWKGRQPYKEAMGVAEAAQEGV